MFCGPQRVDQSVPPSGPDEPLTTDVDPSLLEDPPTAASIELLQPGPWQTILPTSPLEKAVALDELQLTPQRAKLMISTNTRVSIDRRQSG
jgi:hypothetical protein